MLSLLRNAIGVPQLPPNQVLIGLALFLTFFVMAPTWKQINHDRPAAVSANEMTARRGRSSRRMAPLREFMSQADARAATSRSVIPMAKSTAAATADDMPTYVLVPAFMISELKTAFQMGFLVFVPFLIIDIVVSSALMSMGMMMLPPVMISLPFKLLLFVMVDGWHLIVRSLVESFG